MLLEIFSSNYQSPENIRPRLFSGRDNEEREEEYMNECIGEFRISG